jgi:hypothetical protein
VCKLCKSGGPLFLGPHERSNISPVETHVLKAKLRSGRSLELGRLGSFAAAARLWAELRHTLGCEVVSMEIRELDLPITARSVTFEELQQEVRQRGYGDLLHVTRRKH